MADRSKSEKREHDILKARGKFPPELLNWVTRPEREITQDVNRLLDHVMRDRRRRVEVFLTALAKKYVERAVFFTGMQPAVEAELLDPERLKTMKNADLIRLVTWMAGQVTDAAEFLRNFVGDDDLKSEPLPSPGSDIGEEVKDVDVDDVSDDEREAAAAMATESRHRIGSVVRRVLVAIDSTDKSQVPLQLTAPTEEADTDSGEEAPVQSKTKKKSKKKKKKKSKGAAK